MGLNINFSLTYISNIELDMSFLQHIDLTNLDDADIAGIQNFIRDLETILANLLNDPMYPDFGALAGQSGKKLVQQSSRNIGMAFGELADIVQSLKDEVGVNEQVRAIRYIDANFNQFWDQDEVMVFPGVGEMDYGLADALQQILIGLDVNFYQGEPFRLETLLPLSDYFDLRWMKLVLDALELLGISEFDLAATLRDPDPEGLRPLLYDVQELLALIDAALNLL
jgi:hypothetical protein